MGSQRLVVFWVAITNLTSLPRSNLSPESKKSPTRPAERTPQPEYLIALATYLGVRWDSVPFNFSWTESTGPQMPSSWHYWDPTPSWMAQMSTRQGPLEGNAIGDDLPSYMGNLTSLYKDSYKPQIVPSMGTQNLHF